MHTKIRSERGQATTELVVAMLVFLPLFFGVVYIGKFGDIKHQAIQASRFAAFEHALVPEQESVAVVQEETRARFFMDGSRNKGRIGFQDNTTGVATSGTLNPLWSELNGSPLIQSYSDPRRGGIRVDVASNSMDIGAFALVNEASRVFHNLNRNGQVRVDVTVPIANIGHLPAPLNAMNLEVGATTVVAGDAWNGGGAQKVADQQTWLTDVGKNPVLKGLRLLLWPLANVFSDATDGPQFGCVRADVVPSGTAPGASYPHDYHNCW